MPRRASISTRATALVDRIKPAAAATARPGVMAGLGGFGALFDLKAAGYDDPVLVAATDGVGTKLKDRHRHRARRPSASTLSRCASTTWSARAPSRCSSSTISPPESWRSTPPRGRRRHRRGLPLAGCALIGGETAEMPGMYAPGDFDLAGFAVGAMERGGAAARGRARRATCCWACLLGVHSNGYSLVRRIVERRGLGWDAPRRSAPARWARRCWRRRASMSPPRWPRSARAGVHALAHITGGGLTENLPRVLPEGWGRRSTFGWACRRCSAGCGDRRHRRGRDAAHLQLRDRDAVRRPDRCGRDRNAHRHGDAGRRGQLYRGMPG
jgi:phosphoribosylformylglycinamidine cyclo-ligase